MDNEVHFTDLTVGSQHAFHMNGKDFGETWIVTGVSLTGKSRMTINIQTAESYEKESFPLTSITSREISAEDLEEFRKALESCRNDVAKFLCPACPHPTDQHDYVGCNNINFSTEEHCRCLVPYGGSTGTPEKK